MNEKMRILIAYDGSDCATAALDDLRRAGLPRRNVDALVISVAEVWLPPPPPSSYEIVEMATAARPPAELERLYAKSSHAVDEALTLAACAAERLRKIFPGWEVKAEAANGSPAWEIIMKADHWKPNLVVVGSHGRSALGRFVMGSVSQKVLTEARTSVRVARGRMEIDESPLRLVIGVDGSPGSDSAVRAVVMREWPLQTEVRVVVVDDPSVPPGLTRLVPAVTEWVEESEQVEKEWIKTFASRAVETLRRAELDATYVVRQGDPKKMLVEEAQMWDADAIFVGSTGFSNRFERFLLGSVSAAVAARAHCSVEVVRTGAAGEKQ